MCMDTSYLILSRNVRMVCLKKVRDLFYHYISSGKAKLPNDKRFFYDGELDLDGKPLGHGEAVNQYYTKFTGTWLNGA